LKQEFLQRTLGFWRDYAAEPITHEEMIVKEQEEVALEGKEAKTKQIQ
jgi:hypothetical protein